MQIIWRGQSCFEMIFQKGKNNLVNLVIDPFDQGIGLKISKLEADIVLVSHNHSDYNNIKAISGNPFFINGPGEYEIKEVFIQGILGFHDNYQGKERGEITIYIIEAEGMRICHLGDLGQKELSSEQIEEIGNVDILMMPVGGVYTISAKEAASIISQIEPKIIIPMHYQLPKLKLKGKEDKSSFSPSSRKRDLVLDGLDKFLKIMGIKKIEPLSKLSIRKKDLSEEEKKIIVLNP